MLTARRILKRYEIIAQIGVGARSAIYKVRSKKTRQIFAAKVVRANGPEDRKYLRHLDNEFEILKRLQGTGSPHPNIVVAYSLHRGGLLRSDYKYMIMEFVPGRNLVQEADYSAAQIMRIFIQVGEAIEYVHQCGFVHGDLKPENIVVDEAFHAKVVDFGFCCPMHTRLSSIRGTREYIAPEQVTGGLMTEKTDVYNFGATLYRVLTGRTVPQLLPGDANDREIFLVAGGARAEAVSDIRSDVPKGVSDIILACCEHRPEDRPRSMREVITGLAGVALPHGGR